MARTQSFKREMRRSRNKQSVVDQRMNLCHYNERKLKSLGLRGEHCSSKSSKLSGLLKLIPFPATSELK